jgi:hypothetical protein
MATKTWRGRASRAHPGHQRAASHQRAARRAGPVLAETGLAMPAVADVVTLARLARVPSSGGGNWRPVHRGLVLARCAAGDGVAGWLARPALAAAGADTVQRIRRLLGPAEPLGRARRQLLRATAAALALTPVLLALAPAALVLALGRVPAA